MYHQLSAPNTPPLHHSAINGTDPPHLGPLPPRRSLKPHSPYQEPGALISPRQVPSNPQHSYIIHLTTRTYPTSIVPPVKTENHTCTRGYDTPQETTKPHSYVVGPTTPFTMIHWGNLVDGSESGGEDEYGRPSLGIIAFSDSDTEIESDFSSGSDWDTGSMLSGEEDGTDESSERSDGKSEEDKDAKISEDGGGGKVARRKRTEDKGNISGSRDREEEEKEEGDEGDFQLVEDEDLSPRTSQMIFKRLEEQEENMRIMRGLDEKFMPRMCISALEGTYTYTFGFVD